MHRTFVTAVTVGLLTGCSSPSPARPTDAGNDAPTTAAAAPTTAASATPSAEPRCAPGAYTHQAPSFCVELPSTANGQAPTLGNDSVTFQGLVLQWTPKTNTALVDRWKNPGPSADRKGTFEVLATEPMEKGAWHLAHDATQDALHEIAKMPRLEGVAVVAGEEVVVRCAAFANVPGGDPRAVARQHASDLAACKTLRVR